MAQFKELIAQIEADVDGEIAPFVNDGDITAASNYCFNQIMIQLDLIKERGREQVSAYHIQRFFYALKMLQLQLILRHLKPKEIEHAAKFAEISLQRAGIKDSGQASYLLEELCNCKSKLLRQDNKPLGAQWELLLGRKFLEYEHEWTTSAIDETIAAFHLGYAHEATIGYKKILEYRMSHEQMVFVELQFVRSARLSCRFSDAERMLSHLQHDPELSVETRNVLEWEGKWLRLARGGDINDFSVLLSKQRKFPDEPYLSLLMLLGYAHPAGQSLAKNLPSLATLRKRQNKKRSDEDRLIFEILDFFNTLYDYEVPLKRRLSLVTDIIDQVPKLHLEYQLLFFLGLARWAVRSKQNEFAHIPVSRYRFLSEQASSQESDDALGFGRDLIKDRRYFLSFASKDSSFSKTNDQQFVASRSRRVEQWLNYAKIGWHLLGPQPSPRQRVSNVLSTVIKTINSRGISFAFPLGRFFQATVQAGVTFLRLGDDLSSSFAMLYREQQSIEAHNFQSIMLAEFGRPVHELFLAWDETPFASGSIAHIFKATLFDGREVAVKIRRNDIEQRARADFIKFKENILPVVSRFSRAIDKSAFDHVEKLFIDELDFVREASNIQKFFDMFREDPEIIIPGLIPDLCSPNCLTMEYIDGGSVSAFLNQATEEEKSSVARAILRMTFKAAYVFNLFKSDLYESNFRINNGKLVVLDFGRIQSIDPAIFDNHLRGLWKIVYEPSKFCVSVPDSLKVVEPQIQELISRFVLRHHQLTEASTFIPNLDEFVDFMVEHTAIYAPMVSSVKVSELDQLQIWLWVSVLMTKMNVKLDWVSEFKQLFEQYLPNYSAAANEMTTLATERQKKIPA